MKDRPNAVELLRAMAETLTDEVVPATKGGAQHAARVVANLCRILEREWEAGNSGEAKTRDALVSLLGNSNSGSNSDSSSDSDLIAELDQRLKNSDEEFDAKAAEVLLADVRRRLAVDRPGYDS